MFAGLNFGISQGQKVALVARNGAGKSTLLGMLAGANKKLFDKAGFDASDALAPDSGKITWNDNIRVGWLRQEPKMLATNTVLDEVFEADNDTARCVKDYERALAHGDNDKLPGLIERMDALKAWDYEARAKQMLARLYITDFDKEVGKLSGGQRKRVAIANLLLSEPDFLVLDEPTNHLDVEIIEWLEEYLSRSTATLLMVTHDRYFLDRVCNEILELDDHQVFSYSGNYAFYLKKRQERYDTRNAEAAKARNLLRREQDWMDRQPQARGSKAQYRIDAYYELKEKARKVQDANDKSFNLDFGSARLGRKVVDVFNVSKAFGERLLIKDFSYKFARGERVAIVGPNGAGKTTLLNILTGNLATDEGHIETGETVVTGYYRQDGFFSAMYGTDISAEAILQKTVLEVVEDIADQIEKAGGHSVSAPQFLRQFLFPNEMHHIRIEKLSGGERKRLYLVTILMRNPNFLLLDEPTNDLDILSLNVLEEYLQTFGGTVVIVSHDRFFVDKIAEHLFVLDGKGGVKDFPGNYSDYLIWQHGQEREAREAEAAAKREAEKKAKSAAPASTETKTASKPGKLSYAQKRELEQIEKRMPELTTRKQEIEAAMSGGETDGEKIRELSEEYGKVCEELEGLEMRWLEIQEIVEQ